MAALWQPGDTVLLRSVYRGRVRFAMPHRLVELTPERVALYVGPGTRGKRFAGSPLHQVEDLSTYDWSLGDHVWTRNRALRLTPFGAAHSVDLLWDADTDDLRCWYVNLQEPLRPTPLGFDTRDRALDIVVSPDRSWAWKDEDHLEAATALGRFSAEEAASIREEAERVIRLIEAWAPPFCEGWEDWRPDPTWPLPELPPGWENA